MAHAPRSGSNRAGSGGRPRFSPTFAPSRPRESGLRASPATGRTSRAVRSSSGGALSSSSRCWRPAPPSCCTAAAPRARSLPEAAAQTERGWHFLLETGESRALVAGDEVLLDRSFAELESADVRLIATDHRPFAGLPSAPSRARLTGPDLESCHDASLANGLRLAPARLGADPQGRGSNPGSGKRAFALSGRRRGSRRQTSSAAPLAGSLTAHGTNRAHSPPPVLECRRIRSAVLGFPYFLRTAASRSLDATSGRRGGRNRERAQTGRFGHRRNRPAQTIFTWKW